MNWSRCVRVGHRWLSIVFTTGVLIYICVMSLGRPPGWLGLFALIPLILLLLTGLYLFALPYGTRWRSGRRAGADV